MDERIPTFVSGLDERIGGGVPKGHIVLVCGPTGSLKTTFAFNILQSMKDTPSIYITLEQKASSLISQMQHFGMGFDPATHNVALVDIGLIRRKLGFLEKKTLSQIVKMFVKNLQQEMDAEMLVLDSLESLYLLLDMSNPRSELFHFFDELRELGLTTILVSEMDEWQVQYGTHGCETFLADTIIHLTKERVGTSMGRLFRIVKMREVKHPTDYFPLIADKGFTIVTR
jgi:KaiC/GvpD/RAD55 family RecA-like ATPase